MKKIVLAIDSFKGCLTSAEAEAACAEGIRSVYPHCSIVSVPIADGGEGMLDALRELGGEEIQVRVQGPLEEDVDARYRLSPDERTAYIEMASASGLTLVPPEKQNPMLTSTYGTASVWSSGWAEAPPTMGVWGCLGHWAIVFSIAKARRWKGEEKT